ncbi:MAG: SGNH/GDSL hydrolase family protein [Verrucomicrobiota bacterium]|nr:SGNH/GDSL hydrolase family protein [Verrucomicrobiota bacterium]
MNPRRLLPSLLFSHSCATGLLIVAGLWVGALSAFAQQPTPTVAPTPAPNFTQIIVFGDSLSDTGNIRDRTKSKSGGSVDYPGNTFNYSDGRFTNSSDTDPSSKVFVGVWHEQLARTFLNIPASTFSLGGGLNYAFGGATTSNGTHDATVVSTPFFGDVAITIDDMGRQMDDYLAGHAIDANALYVVWGGGNDLLNDDTPASVTAAAARATALFNRLANAGAKYIMVPNVPPLGVAPGLAGDSARMKSLSAAAANYRLELSANLTASLSMLASQGITPALYPVDAWTNTIRVLTYPSKYGFTDTLHSAQGNSNISPDTYLFWDGLHPTTAGHYQTAKGAHDALTLPFVDNAKAVNLATRAFVDVGERVAIAGFIVSGNVSKKVLIRGIGPSLAANGVSNFLADPTVTLFDEPGNPLMTNDNWRQSPDATAINNTGIPPKNDAESAIIATLAPGHYTAVLSGVNASAGNGVIEVYDLESGTSSTLENVSTRGYVGAGDNAMIGGLIIGAGELPIVVLRAIGPTLTNAGIADPLLDPTIELHDGNGAVIAFNDDWKLGQPQSVIATQFAPSDDRESVIVAFLAPGNYTAVVRGKGGTTGVALVEAYRIP